MAKTVYITKEKVNSTFKFISEFSEKEEVKVSLEDEIIYDYKLLIKNVNKAIDVHSSYKVNYKILRKKHLDEMIEILKEESRKN